MKTKTNPIISHKNEYSSLSFFLRTNSIIPRRIITPMAITMIFNLVEMTPPLNYFFLRKSITKIDNNVLKI